MGRVEGARTLEGGGICSLARPFVWLEAPVEKEVELGAKKSLFMGDFQSCQFPDLSDNMVP